jgi:hypothetical protein
MPMQVLVDLFSPGIGVAPNRIDSKFGGNVGDWVKGQVLQTRISKSAHLEGQIAAHIRLRPDRLGGMIRCL